MASVTVQPADRYNEELVSHVHPSDWNNPEPSGPYNVVVIGAGTAGLISASVAASLGAKVALIERHLMGGDCLNVGCVPSKGLIRSARMVAETRRAGEFGLRLSNAGELDFATVTERMRRIRSEISHHDSTARYRDEFGVDVYLGEARFTGKDRIEVDGKELRFARAIIATGARAAAPPIPGLEEAGYLTNETLFELTELPKRLAVLGGGPIGCEMAQTFRRFGSEVSLVEMAPRILPREDPDVSELLMQKLSSEGVQLLTERGVTGVASSGGGKRLSLSNGEEIEVDQLLVAVGRAPNVAGLGLEEAGISYDRRSGVEVNKYLQTSNRRVYAAGDIAYTYKFTHAAEATAAIAVQNALFLRTKKTDGLVIPWVTYTSPEVAHVGINEAQANESAGDIETYTHHFDATDRGRLDGESGIVKLHARKGRLLGATVVGEHAGEMIGELVLALQKGMSLGDLNGVVHPYPTQAEAIKRAAAGPMKAKLTARTKALLGKWMALRR